MKQLEGTCMPKISTIVFNIMPRFQIIQSSCCYLRKHFPCLYQVIETQVEVGETAKCLFELFQTYKLIETWREKERKITHQYFKYENQILFPGGSFRQQLMLVLCFYRAFLPGVFKS